MNRLNLMQVMALVGATFLCSTLISQDVSPIVISNSGGTSSNPEITIDWTIGETLGNFNSLEGLILSEGFHQPLLTVTMLDVPESSNSEFQNISVYPNPVVSQLTIDVGESTEYPVQCQLTDVKGKIIKSFTLSSGTREIVDVSYLASGAYLLEFVLPEEGSRSTYRIIKSD